MIKKAVGPGFGKAGESVSEGLSETLEQAPALASDLKNFGSEFWGNFRHSFLQFEFSAIEGLHYGRGLFNSGKRFLVWGKQSLPYTAESKACIIPRNPRSQTFAPK